MNFRFFTALALSLLGTVCWAQTSQGPLTFCNPLNLNYRFCLDQPSRREAADPVIVMFRNEYFLFASKSGGYWHSKDLVNWALITTNDLPLEDYAPAAVVIDDEMYFTASTGNGVRKIYKSSNPLSGKWQVANGDFPFDYADPDLFLDDDGRLYLYYGCSNVNPIYVVELDRRTLMPVGEPTVCFNERSAENGFERPGDHNEIARKPWTEGAWTTKVNGKYYLQYSTPGTEFRSYCDGIYVADKPLGPFTLMKNNPFSYRPGGFATSAGHSGTFQDRHGNFWHITTSTISVKHMFERRLSLFPAFFNDENRIYTYTGYGDYPMVVPQQKVESEKAYASDWMLLSYKKPISASSTTPDHNLNLASDEDIRTYWSAKSGDKGEWLSIDLMEAKTINAIQLNFAEHKTDVLGRRDDLFYQYIVEHSEDGKKWKMLLDKSSNKVDAPHDYSVLASAVKARYLRVTNLRTPSGTFAISDFRVFGKGAGKTPSVAANPSAIRDESDRCKVRLQWKGDPSATGYNVRFGRTRDHLYLHYQVYGATELDINSLMKEGEYFFVIDSFNENGITPGTTILNVK